MDSSSNNLLTVQDVGRSFEDMGERRIVLENVSFRLGEGESLAVIGPSGCGKTTLVLMISGLLAPTSGRIDIRDMPVKPGRKEVALVLQDYGLFPWKTVRQNIDLGVRVRSLDYTVLEVEALEEELGIAGMGHLYPQQLSGGQRQRVALARALLLKPELLLLDEPFAALDALTRERLQILVLELFKRRRLSFIVVTHNIEEALILGNRVLVLAGNPARVAGVIDNPTFGRENQRVLDDFFGATIKLRRLLEDSH